MLIGKDWVNHAEKMKIEQKGQWKNEVEKQRALIDKKIIDRHIINLINQILSMRRKSSLNE